MKYKYTWEFVSQFVWSDKKPDGTWKIVKDKSEESCKACFIDYNRKDAVWESEAPSNSYVKVDITKNSCTCPLVEINKKDIITHSVINGAVLGLTDYNNIDAGSVKLNICPGKIYELKEIKSPNGYMLSNEKIKLEIKDKKLFINNKESDKLKVDFDNTPISLKIIKVDENTVFFTQPEEQVVKKFLEQL